MDYQNFGELGSIRHMPTPKTLLNPNKHIAIKFPHGLGDCVWMSHLLGLYLNRNYTIKIDVSGPKKATIFKALGKNVEVVQRGNVCNQNTHQWHPPNTLIGGTDDDPNFNKIASNVGQTPLPDIGSPKDIWKELLTVSFNLDNIVTDKEKERVDLFLKTLPTGFPIIAVHAIGHSFKDRKSLSKSEQTRLCFRLIDELDAVIILCEYADPPLQLNHYKVRSISKTFQDKEFSVGESYYLFSKMDLFIGIDSGPLYLAILTGIPCIGVWKDKGKDWRSYPASVTLPKPNLLNITTNKVKEINQNRRVVWNIVESPHDIIRPVFIAQQAKSILSKPEYIPEDRIANTQLKQFIHQTQGGITQAPTHSYSDRHKSSHVLYKYLARVKNPTILEVGSSSGELEEWSVGYSTYIFSVYCSKRGGTLTTIDVRGDIRHPKLKKKIDVFSNSTTFISGDGEQSLKNYQGPKLDLLYLDGLGQCRGSEQEYTNQSQQQLKAGLQHLRVGGILLIDDTVYGNNKWYGKGAIYVQALLDSNNWKPLYLGHQLVLERLK